MLQADSNWTCGAANEPFIDLILTHSSSVCLSFLCLSTGGWEFSFSLLELLTNFCVFPEPTPGHTFGTNVLLSAELPTFLAVSVLNASS
jgi:hypothetical protein